MIRSEFDFQNSNTTNGNTNYIMNTTELLESNEEKNIYSNANTNNVDDNPGNSDTTSTSSNKGNNVKSDYVNYIINRAELYIVVNYPHLIGLNQRR